MNPENQNENQTTENQTAAEEEVNERRNYERFYRFARQCGCDLRNGALYSAEGKCITPCLTELVNGQDNSHLWDEEECMMLYEAIKEITRITEDGSQWRARTRRPQKNE